MKLKTTRNLYTTQCYQVLHPQSATSLKPHTDLLLSVIIIIIIIILKVEFEIRRRLKRERTIFDLLVHSQNVYNSQG